MQDRNVNGSLGVHFTLKTMGFKQLKKSREDLTQRGNNILRDTDHDGTMWKI